MDRLPITPLHRRATVVIGLGQFFDLYEIFLAGVLSSGAGKTFHLDKAVLRCCCRRRSSGCSWAPSRSAGWPTGWAGARRSCSAWPSTRCSRCSRRSARARRCWWSRGSSPGIGIGAEPPIADTYLGDMLPPRHRGRYIALAYTIGFLGVPAAGFLARGLVPIAPLGVDGLAVDVRDRRARRRRGRVLRRRCRSRRAGSARRPHRGGRRGRPPVRGRGPAADAARARPRTAGREPVTAGRSASCCGRPTAGAR